MKLHKTEYEIADLMRRWQKINNMGRRNQGIYISENFKDRIIKAGTNGELVHKLNSEMLQQDRFIIFPIIHNIYITPTLTFTEMQRFYGNVTELLFKVLPRYIIDHLLHVDDDIKEDIWFVFRNMITNTCESKQYRVKLLPLHEYLYGKNSKLESLKYILLIQKNKEKLFDGFHISPNMKIEEIIKPLNNLYELEDSLHDSKLTKKIFDDFFQLFVHHLRIMIPEITKQIIQIKLVLRKINKCYKDNKLDNYVFQLSSEKRPHLGIEFNNNHFFGQYFYIYAIDWDSCLFDMEKDTDQKIIQDFNTQITNYYMHGESHFTNTLTKILSCKSRNYDFSDEIYNIITTEYRINLGFVTLNYKSIEEIMELIGK